MKRCFFVLTLALVVPLLGQTMAETDVAEAEWSVKASYLDACCCAPSCPCLFGSPPTLGFCEGVTLIDFDKATYGDVRVDGVKVLAVYRSGAWIKFYVDESATADQTEAVVKLLPTFEEFFAVENVVEVKNVPISLERGEDTIKVSTPNTIAHLMIMTGTNGQPIKIANLPAPSFPAPPFLDHTQYRTILLKHDSKQQTFEHSGTNGFTTTIDVKSEEEN